MLSDAGEGGFAWMHLAVPTAVDQFSRRLGGRRGREPESDAASGERIVTCAAHRGQLRLPAPPIQRSFCREQGAETMLSSAE